MRVLVIEPGNGSHWLERAQYVDEMGTPDPEAPFVTGEVWSYDGGWNMPDDYLGQWESYTTTRALIRKIEPA